MNVRLLVKHALPHGAAGKSAKIYAETGGALERKARQRRLLSSEAATARKAIARAGGATNDSTAGEPADDSTGAKLKQSSQIECAAGLTLWTVAAACGTCE